MGDGEDRWSLLPSLLVPVGRSCFVVDLAALVVDDDGRLGSAWAGVGA